MGAHKVNSLLVIAHKVLLLLLFFEAREPVAVSLSDANKVNPLLVIAHKPHKIHFSLLFFDDKEPSAPTLGCAQD